MEQTFFETFDLNFKEHERHVFEDAYVCKLSATPDKSLFRVYLRCGHIIEKKNIAKAEKLIAGRYFDASKTHVKIIEKYELSELYTPQSLFELYRESISYELGEYDVLLKLLFDESEFSFGEQVLEIALPQTLIAEEKAGELEHILDRIFNERFGCKLIVNYTFCERKADESRQIKDQLVLNKIEHIIKASSMADRSGELAIVRTPEKEHAKPPAPEKKKPAEREKKFPQKKQFRGQSYGASHQDPDVIYGRGISMSEPMPIADIVGDMGEVLIRGEIFKLDFRSIRNERTIVTLYVTDQTDSIMVKMFVKNERLPEIESNFKKGGAYLIQGVASMDPFDKEIEITSVTGVKKTTIEKTGRTDDYPLKRVELHAHTKMSEMDGLSDIGELVKTAKRFGHKALALTDHGVVTAFPEATHFVDKGDDFKLIFGVEAYLVDDLTTIAKGDDLEKLELDGSFVVFDLETTGFSRKACRIIEIGAVKVCGGAVVDRFSTFVNPKVPIPFRITEVTSIRDDMVLDAPTIEEALPAFLEFCKGSVLVGHNADFDTGFIRQNCENLGLEYSFGVVDTVAMARFLLPKMKGYKLHQVAKTLNVTLEHHHRAVDDAQCTALIFLKLAEMAKNQGVRTLQELNEKGTLDAAAIGKLHRYHAILLTKNDIGRTNLYRLISMSHITYFHKFPLMPKSEIMKHREGLILGSACSAGELYEAILLGKSDEEIYRIAEFYDYLEIQPDGNNQYLLRDEASEVHSVEDLHAINRQIIALADAQKKMVCATGDVHFVNPEDEIYRSIIKNVQGYKDSDSECPLYFRSTEEMLAEFAYLGEERAREVVITNTNKIADMCERIAPVRPDKAPPVIDNSDEELRSMCHKKAHEIYGPTLPKIVEDRLERELNSIISNGYAVMYIIAQKLVTKSVSDGYLVGSRGSVGSSFVATMADITEVNPLPPHYYCPKCHYHDFDSEEVRAYAGRAGCDMPDKICPECGEPLSKDGFDIPFETFLGFKGDKEPDIDLNFSGEYQGKAHRYTEVIFGEGHTFKAGTVSTVADKTAFGYTRKFFEAKETPKRRCELERIAAHVEGVKSTTGQHPGGIVVLPMGEEIHTFTPIQKPANDMTTDVITTHFDYHRIDHNLLKLDILGHADPTMIRRLEDLTGIKATTIKFDDPDVMRLFQSTEPLGLTPADIGGIELGTLGIPEFGTEFAMGMLIDTKPREFSDLVRIAGLSHGTDVWLGNAKDLILSGTATISTCICTRDDIMTYLIQMGVDAAESFSIMESVRKGKVAKNPQDEKWQAQRADMLSHGVPEWYVESCEKIKYMFPKAHAAAYVMMAWRVAWYKINYPKEYYAAFYSIRTKAFNYELMCQGRDKLRFYMEDYTRRSDSLSAVETQALKEMKLVDEMYARGIEFTPIDIYRADAERFLIIDGKIMPAFTAIDGMGPEAAEQICTARSGERFLSCDDFKTRGKVPQTVVDNMAALGLLEGLPKSNQISLFDLM